MEMSVAYKKMMKMALYKYSDRHMQPQDNNTAQVDFVAQLQIALAKLEHMAPSTKIPINQETVKNTLIKCVTI